MTVAKFRKPVTNHKLLVNYTRKWHSLREACHCFSGVILSFLPMSFFIEKVNYKIRYCE